MAGGSVLNSVGNGRMITERVVDRAYFHPAASDDGTAAGAALHVYHGVHGGPRAAPLRHAYLGTAWTDAQIEEALLASGLPTRGSAAIPSSRRTADALAQGKIVGWFQGREEWGPRALGNRSILCHPGWPGMKATLNARIKNREPFRPFAPAIRAEKLSTCFHGAHEVPFMIIVYKVRPEWKERLAAVTHEDGTGRVQTVRREDNAHLLRSHRRVRRADGHPRPPQHLVQRERAHRPHPGAGHRLLLPDAHGRAGDRLVLAGEAARPLSPAGGVWTSPRTRRNTSLA